jgi:hypothetical protein
MDASRIQYLHLSNIPLMTFTESGQNRPGKKDKEGKVFYFKGCPRCKGDVYVEKDSFGTYRKCLQCGRMQDLELRRPATNRRKGSKLVA